jgi:hypothetical protein
MSTGAATGVQDPLARPGPKVVQAVASLQDNEGAGGVIVLISPSIVTVSDTGSSD